jgi:hypothetical protein
VPARSLVLFVISSLLTLSKNAIDADFYVILSAWLQEKLLCFAFNENACNGMKVRTERSALNILVLFIEGKMHWTI